MTSTLPYDICVALLNAGFPMREADATSTGVFAYPFGGAHNWVCPTLEELIEACGRVWVGPCEQGWHSGFDGHPFSHLDENRPQGCGKTPSEAVANLYLAITK